MGSAFEVALAARVETMLDACTACGKCFEACPITGAAGVVGEPHNIAAGEIESAFRCRCRACPGNLDKERTAAPG
jgi:Fe-S-cluster-containing hydrogenase component 2